ncbi:MAG: Asp-tRNA(Asn)/Glu-tRNA(Gln) amidotransferase subunit GatC [Candidatus Beckwithbacteria bacterium]|nr:Asp-tRNA(Asn)/Glu-tRNA(Gln) amidotransferase subunit GatC [Patescibacteria group bacterium]
MIDINHLANLANMKVSQEEGKKLENGFKESLKSVDLLNKIDTKGISSSFQVTSLKNIYRQDKVDHSRCLTQKQALSNAKKTYQGYFVVPYVFS